MKNPFSFREEPARTVLLWEGVEMNSAELDHPPTAEQRGAQKDVLLIWAMSRLSRLARDHGRSV